MCATAYIVQRLEREREREEESNGLHIVTKLIAVKR
jgi:hypothetical protein